MRVLRARYGSLEVSSMSMEENLRGKKVSKWWKNLIQSGCFTSLDWFLDGLSRRLGCGDRSKFLGDKWLGERPLKEVFPRLYMLSNQKM